jgi:FdhE protein
MGVIKILKLEQRPVTVEDLRNEVDYYKNKEPELRELLDFYLNIYEVQHRYNAEIELQIDLTDEQAKRKLKQDKYLLEGEKVDIDSEIFKKLLDDLSHIIEEKSKFKGELDRLIQAPELQKENISSFIEKIISNDSAYLAEFAERIKIKKDIVFFLTQNVLSPFYQKCAENLRPQINYSLWLKGSCPVCGHKPLAAKLRKEEGLRLLQCSLCQTQWWFLRLKCAFCGNTDHEKLQYLYLEEDRGRRVDVCDSCKKYIKTFDERVLGREVIPHIEEVATIHLDFAAKKEGYIPGAQYVAAQ